MKTKLVTIALLLGAMLISCEDNKMETIDKNLLVGEYGWKSEIITTNDGWNGCYYYSFTEDGGFLKSSNFDNVDKGIGIVFDLITGNYSIEGNNLFIWGKEKVGSTLEELCSSDFVDMPKRKIEIEIISATKLIIEGIEYKRIALLD